MKIHVDSAACEGHGLCAQVAPEVYEIDDEGYVQMRVSDIPPTLAEAAASGARVCPVAALKVVEAASPEESRQ